jgi:predicted nucleic acid-binding protein
VRKEYVGTGELARIISEGDAIRRATAEGERQSQRAEVERIEDLAAPVLELDEVAEVLARAVLIAGGFHRHKGEWRRERTT